jgi:hypothetical protein
VMRREGHMVAGGRGHGAEALSSRAGRSAPVEGFTGDPPAFAGAQGEQELWGELCNHGAALDRALNEALRIHGGPAWRVFQVGCCCLFFSFSRFCARSCSMMLTGFDLLVTGARAPHPRQVHRL